jgi:N12 class adenine-specific DNA methylase
LLPKDRERLELQWNIEFNGNLDLDINKVPIGFQFAKMYNGEFPNDIRPEKRRSLVFNMMQGSSLLAYGVGLGKTYCAIYNLAQNLEYGFCKRPLIILPNQVYPQFIKEINGLIPQYKINKLFNLRGVYSFLNQKIDDYSISVCTYEGLQQIAFSDDLDLNFFIKLGTILSSGEYMSQKQRENEAEKFREIIGKAKSETSVNFDDENTIIADDEFVDDAEYLPNSAKVYNSEKYI